MLLPIFHSEADFQLAFGWLLQRRFPGPDVRLEWRAPLRDRRLYLDIYMDVDGEKWGLELKYKTRPIATTVRGELFELKSHGAQDLGRYDYLRDVERIEAYDNESRLHTETDPLSHVRTYGYDAAGRLTSRQDAKSQTTTYIYNDRNELTNLTYPDLSYVSFVYNDAGARTQMVDSTGTTAYSYDNLFRLTGVTFPGARTVSYGYDDASRRTSITYPGGSDQVTYAYDVANRLSTVTDWNSNQTAYTYDDANRMTTVTLPNGVVGTSTYDNANRLTGTSYVKSSTTLAAVSYTVDAVGNRSDRTDAAGTETYSYDDLYRLTSVTYPGPTTTSYGYDAFGNRTSMTVAGATTNYSYDDASRLATVTPPSPASAISYTWDENGDLTARGSDSFGWDYEDRMTSATVGATSYSYSYSYSYRGDGLRNTASDGTATTSYTWDINAGLPVVLDDGAQYIYGNGLISQVAGANSYYYLSDGLGSTLKTTDASGNVVNDYTYDVYGKTTSSSGSQANDVQFAGQQADPTGLQYLRARYYDPSTGSFLSRDPLSAMPGWSGSPFGYAGGNPASKVDPSGRDGGSPMCPEGYCGGLMAGGDGQLGVGEGGEGRGAGEGPSGIGIDITEPRLEAPAGWQGKPVGLEGEYAGFRNATLRDKHVGDHQTEWDGESRGYLDEVRRFFSDPAHNISFVQADGDTVSYNVATNDFGVVSADGYVRTLFKPEQGAAYFWRQLVNH